ncbi:hypothetical protein, partial [Xanthomonas citri]|uniref:hypothetical protein n=1 Tax=Xanthomonas citri TaxID=346 RepID=UPI001C2CC3FE
MDVATHLYDAPVAVHRCTQCSGVHCTRSRRARRAAGVISVHAVVTQVRCKRSLAPRDLCR